MTIIDIVIPVLATASMLAAAIFVWRGMRYRSRSSRAAYGVAQQEARQAMQVDFVRGIAAAFVGLILIGVMGLSAGPLEVEATATQEAPTARPTATAGPTDAPSATATSAPASVVTVESPTAEPTATSPVSTVAPTTAPTITPTPGPLTATVTSPVGVWLRAEPSTEGEQLEWLLEGTVVVVLSGFETAADLDWQQVRAPDGVEGWVAAEFIAYNE